MERNGAAAEPHHSVVLNPIRDAVEITRLRERIVRREAEREPKLQRPA